MEDKNPHLAVNSSPLSRAVAAVAAFSSFGAVKEAVEVRRLALKMWLEWKN